MYNSIAEELMIEINTLAEESIGQKIEIDVNDEILEQGILDSPAIIALIAFIEKKYQINIELDEMDIDNFGTIKKIEKLIKSKIG
jgi:acyl carrier protein